MANRGDVVLRDNVCGETVGGEIVCGDIGGTKTQLAVVNPQTRQFDPVTVFANKDFASFDTLFTQFIQQRSIAAVAECHLAVAGPVQRNHCQLTNLSWALDAAELQARFSMNRVTLINDLAASAYGLLNIPECEFILLQGAVPYLREQTLAIVSPGTGLGEATLFWDERDANYHVVSGEGGHKSLPVFSAQEVDLLSYLLARTESSAISAESIISGQGLVTLVQYLADNEGAGLRGAEELASLAASHEPNQEIVQRAGVSPHSIYAEALRLFIRLLANEASNLAVQNNCSGGIILAGGIPPKIADFLQAGDFIERFQEKAIFPGWLRQLPIAICTNTRLPLIGAYFSSVSSTQG